MFLPRQVLSPDGNHGQLEIARFKCQVKTPDTGDRGEALMKNFGQVLKKNPGTHPVRCYHLTVTTVN
jgi:hypothetical protein